MTRQELETVIKQASNVMRADDNTKLVTKYIEHLSWLLFLKAFDAIEDEQLILDPDYRRVLKGKYRWSAWAQKDWKADELIRFVTDELLPHLRSLKGDAPKRLVATIFNGVTAVMKSGYSFKEVIALVDGLDFHSEEDVHTISLVYESLLARLGSEAGWSGEFYTPRPVVRLMVKVVDPRIGETVYDPAAGSGGFLAESFEHLRLQEQTLQDHRVLQERTFHGQENGELPFLLGIMNLILHGVRSHSIVRRNTLEEDVRTIRPKDQHDVVLTNPPFGGHESRQIQQNFPVRAQATELLFLQHVLRKVKPGGRCGIVLPDGILFRDEGAFASLRRSVVDDFALEAVVRLPPGVFPTARDSRTNLLFIRRDVPGETIRFYQLPPPPGVRQFSKNREIDYDDLNGAMGWLTNGTADSFAWEVPLTDVRRNGFKLDLRPPRSRTRSTRKRGAVEEIERLQTQIPRLGQLFQDVATDSRSFTLQSPELLGKFLEKRDIRAGTERPTKFVGVSKVGGIVPFKGKVAKDTSRYRQLSRGDLAYNPMRVNVGSIALCRHEEQEGFVSSEYVVFRLNEDAPFGPEYVLHFLRSRSGQEEIARNAKGSVRARLYFDNLCDVRIPLPVNPDAWEQLFVGLNEIGEIRSVATRLEGSIFDRFVGDADPQQRAHPPRDK